MSQREIYRIEKLPVLQNRVFNSVEAALKGPVGDVVLVQDNETGLVFNSCFDPHKINYDGEYQNEQALSNVFRDHLGEVANIIQRHLDNCSLVEIGCGKGYFLGHLKSLGCEITGVDPAYQGTDPTIIKKLFQSGLDLSADGIILRHVLEHIPEPIEFLSSIARENHRKRLIYIEIPCFDWICQNRAWFDIYYEHVNYFRLGDFDQMFGSVIESGHIFGGQYLYVVADLSSLRTPKFHETNRVDFSADFSAGIERILTVVKRRCRNVIWGVASKGVIFSIHMARNAIQINLGIDINPAKQGKYLATSGLQVFSPVDAFALISQHDNIFVMNSNYLDEIIVQSKHKYNYYGVDYDRF